VQSINVKAIKIALSHIYFRGISISCVIYTLFEMAIIDRYSSYFGTSNNQFGFKRALAVETLFNTVRFVIEHFVSDGSTVNVCALDLTQAV